MRATEIRPLLRYMVTALALCSVSRGHAQTYSESSEDVPCPPSIRAIYTDPGLGFSFWGLATYSMKQPDGLNTYVFNGVSADAQWRIKGFAHVAQSDCVVAYYAYWRGITVPLLDLHNVQLFHRGTACSGSYQSKFVDDQQYDPYQDYEYGDWVEVDPSNPYSSTYSNCNLPPAGSGGTWAGPAGSTCHWGWLSLEISYDDGKTWQLLWEGWVAVCE